MATELLNLGGLPTLPATANTVLIAGWISTLAAGESFVALNDRGTAGVRVEIASDTAGQTAWAISAKDSGSAPIFSASVSTTPDFQTGWHSYAMSIDVSTKTIQLLADRALFLFPMGSAGVTWNSANQIAFFPGVDTWVIGPVTGTGYGVDVSDFWFDAGMPFFDLSIAANVDKLFGPGNVPIFWGTDGSLVTGARPAVDLEGNSVTYPSNLGSGGPFIDGGGDPLADAPGPSGGITSPATGGTAGPGNPWYASFSVGGKFTDMSVNEWDGNYEIFNILAPVNLTFQSNFTPSPSPTCEVAPAADVTLTLQSISAGVPTTVGILTIVAGSKTGNLVTPFSPGLLTVFAGNSLRLYAPSDVDTTIVGLSGTIIGAR